MSLVGPHLEYASDVWDPHLLKDKKLIENVQKYGLRICTKQWNLSYNELLSNFAVSMIQSHQLEHKLSTMFKIVHNLMFFLPPFLYHTRVELALMLIFKLLCTQTLSCTLLFLALFHYGIHYLVMSLAHIHFLSLKPTYMHLPVTCFLSCRLDTLILAFVSYCCIQCSEA